MGAAEETFAAIAEELLREPGIDEGTGFGTNPGLRAGGKIFAMLVRGELVFKLPADRVGELTAGGGARRLAVGKREMREWIAVTDADRYDCDALAREALDFVRG